MRGAAMALCLVALAACHRAPDDPPGTAGIRAVTFTIHSQLLGRSLDEIGLVPPPLASGRPRPLVVFLHGRGSSPATVMRRDGLIGAMAALGSRAPIVVIANGGTASYYHDRADGPWGRHVVAELIPQAVGRLGADTARVAIEGESMGGFGALDIGRLWPHRFCAVGAHSAALFRTAGDTTAGSFDDAEDFGRHDLFAAVAADPDLYGDTPVWMDVGLSDPFRPADMAFEEALHRGGAKITFQLWPGGHGDAYWHAHMTTYLAFSATALAACRL